MFKSKDENLKAISMERIKQSAQGLLTRFHRFSRLAALTKQLEESVIDRTKQLGEVNEAFHFLMQTNDLLFSSLDYELNLKNLASLLVPSFCDWSCIDIISDDCTRQRVALQHSDPKKLELSKEAERPYGGKVSETDSLWTVYKTGTTYLTNDITIEMLKLGAKDEAHFQILKELQLHACILVPLKAAGKVYGVMSLFMAESERKFTPQAVTLIEEIAKRAGVAIENARLYQEAQAANRSKDEFLSTLSHELRTPLSAIIGWADLLSEGEVDKTLLQEGLEALRRNARTQVEIINDILDVSRIITGKIKLSFETTNVIDCINLAIDSMQSTADSKKITIKREYSTDEISVYGDANRLQQIFWNLLSNAVKFSPAQSQIVIKTAVHNDKLCVEVIDHGEGIDAEFLPFIFGRFQQQDGSRTRRYGGLGLGLSLVRHLTELHGGNARVKSEGRGQGSVFTISLPILL